VVGLAILPGPGIGVGYELGLGGVCVFAFIVRKFCRLGEGEGGREFGRGPGLGGTGAPLTPLSDAEEGRCDCNDGDGAASGGVETCLRFVSLAPPASAFFAAKERRNPHSGHSPAKWRASNSEASGACSRSAVSRRGSILRSAMRIINTEV
jgi:hypothetical protein